MHESEELRKNKNPSSFNYPYSNTSDDQYEESEEFDLSADENQSSDDGSITSEQNQFRQLKDKQPSTTLPYRRKSFTTSKSHISSKSSSRSSSISNSFASEDSTATVTLPLKPSVTNPTPALTNLQISNTSTATNDTCSVHSAISPTVISASSDTPEKLDLTESRLPTPSSAPIFKDRRPTTPIAGSSTNTNSMTVETETVSAVPTLSVAAAGGSGSTIVKVKKSIDNVNKSLRRAKKKKSSRLGSQASKAEVFAAKIASAVDEAQSSDSDETFVYESNPHDSHLVTPNSIRPRFQTRNSSSSSLPHPNFIPQPQNFNLSQTLPLVPPGSSSSNTPSSPRIDSYQTLTLTKRSNAQKQYQQQLLVQQQQQQQLTASSDHPSRHQLQLLHQYSLDPLNEQATLPNSQPNSPQLLQQSSFYGSKGHYGRYNIPVDSPSSVIQDPMESSVSDSREMDSHKRTLSTSEVPRRALKNSHIQTSNGVPHSLRRDLKKQPSSQLRVLSNKHFDSVNAGYKTHGQHPLRWNRGYNEEDEEDAIYNDIDEDFDEDDYYGYSETTPLRVNGSGRNGQRRSRKNGGSSLRAYSPHNYQRQSGSMSRYQRVRTALWLFLATLTILGAGFMMGFLLATNKPLHSVTVPDIFDVLVSDEELLFDVVIEAINPGFLSIDVSEIDLDVFARSPYVIDDGREIQGTEDGSDGPHTMLLGNIEHFEVPLVFDGGFFSKRVQKSVGQLRLVHPGRNTTATNGGGGGGGGDDEEEGHDEKSKDPNIDNYDPIDDFPLRDIVNFGEDLDSGQRKWARLNVHPFELIIRGVMCYELPLSRGINLASISKVSNTWHDKVYIIWRLILTNTI